ncbi:MAG TPA: hypothetical protein VIP09_06525 [Dehalococcoidia bacterium]|jgi:hypothetical protein
MTHPESESTNPQSTQPEPAASTPIVPSSAAGQPMDATAPAPQTTQITPAERVERLSKIVSAKTLEGWTVVDKNDRDVSAVLMLQGKPVNHVLHFLIGLFTCGIWWIVWAILALTQKKEQRMRVSVDQFGNLLEEKMAVS